MAWRSYSGIRMIGLESGFRNTHVAKQREHTSLFPTTRATLLAQLGDPTARAWDDFFRIYGPIIFRIARRTGLSCEESEEIVATVMRNFVSSVRSGFQLDEEKGRFRHYLRKITYRSIRTHRVRSARVPTPSTPVVEQAADNSRGGDVAAWSETERQERLRFCLDRLRDSKSIQARDWAAFECDVVRGEKAAIVAKRFSMRVEALYRLKHRMLKRLQTVREKLDREVGED